LQHPTGGKPDFLWNLEIKIPAALDQTIALIDRYRAARKILVTSFCHPVIAEICWRDIEVDCGLLVCHRPVDMRTLPSWIPNHPRLKTVVWYWETIDAALIAQSAACGLRNYVYGVTTREEHARLADLGLDGVITDHPEYMLKRISP
jgi:glycerophosphoryl diester phosphodiesterase